MSSEAVRPTAHVVKSFARERGLLPQGSRVLVACSGGADSMALLSILRELAGDLRLHIEVGHIDHGIRDTRVDREMVAAVCERWALPLHISSCDAPRAARRTGESLEAAARRERYRLLAAIAEETGADRIATGHTRDDQVETVLMRIVRGTGLRGLAGIPARRGHIVRPVLCIGHRDTVRLCAAAGIRYAEDPTNTDIRHFRNRVRHELLPRLRADYHPRIDASLLRTAEQASEVLAEIRSRTLPLKRLHWRQERPGQWVVELRPLAVLDDASLAVFFGDAVAECMGADTDLRRVHHLTLRRLVRDPLASGKAVSLPGLKAERHYDRVVLSATSRGDNETPVPDPRLVTPRPTPLTVPGTTHSAGIRVDTELVERSHVQATDLRASTCNACFDPSKLELPLVLRAPRAGDSMQPFGMRGHKKLSDIFIDRKISRRERSQALVVADARRIVWLVGVTTGDPTRVDAESGRVLRITISRPDRPGNAGASGSTATEGRRHS